MTRDEIEDAKRERKLKEQRYKDTEENNGEPKKPEYNEDGNEER